MSRAITATMPTTTPAMAPEEKEEPEPDDSLEPDFSFHSGERMFSMLVSATLFSSQAQGATVKLPLL
jgi:hypothetical protein